MKKDTPRDRKLAAATREARRPRKEPLLTQIASFADLFVWLLVLKSFFLPLFIIPTGSMAETLAGAHAMYTCPNCGYEYPVGFHTKAGPPIVQCPNCRYEQPTRRERPDGVRLIAKAGDRIVVHGWPYDIGGRFGPRRWDVVVFKNPNEPDINYIKRLIGLPGETIEIIDGDIFVKGRDDQVLHSARKTPHAQRALWFPYYDHDYPPRERTVDVYARRAGQRERWPVYHPRWVAVDDPTAWKGLDTRTPRFEGVDSPRKQVQFVTRATKDAPPGRILDIYGYNSFEVQYHEVTDVRLSTDVEIECGEGYVELSISKYHDFFHARLYADGRVTLERENQQTRQREEWGTTRIPLPTHPFRLALAHADYHVAVEIDGKTVLESPPRYGAGPEPARKRSRLKMSPTIRLGAERVGASFAHLLIERDVYYVSGNLRDGRANPGTGTQRHPITLKDDAYFVCGDNSPASHDSRAWSAKDLGPHLQAAHQEDRYNIGTVPADQLIGQAFLVYWPGFLPLSERGWNLLPDLGRVRWIH